MVFVGYRVLCETVKDFVAKVGQAHKEEADDCDMSDKVRGPCYKQAYAHWIFYRIQFITFLLYWRFETRRL